MPSIFLTLEHVAEQFFHRCVSDSAAEKQVLDAFWRDKSQERKEQQQSTKPASNDRSVVTKQ